MVADVTLQVLIGIQQHPVLVAASRINSLAQLAEQVYQGMMLFINALNVCCEVLAPFNFFHATKASRANRVSIRMANMVP